MECISNKCTNNKVLLYAGVYNIIWGIWVVLFPNHFFELLSLEQPNYPSIWQSVGMIVGVFGIGYLITSYNPKQFWPLILVGFLGKVFGVIGFSWTQIQGTLDPRFGVTILTNDIIWLVPFYLLLKDIYDSHIKEQENISVSIPKALSQFKVGEKTLFEITQEHKTLLLFLRHAGCTFCRETLSKLKLREKEIEKEGLRIIAVHMGSESDGKFLKSQFALDTVTFISDPERILYRSFGLRRGNVLQLFGPSVWIKGFYSGVVKGLGIGPLQGDGFQMPGAYVFHKGNIIVSDVAQSASDTPKFDALMCAVPANEA